MLNKEYQKWFVETINDPVKWSEAFLRNPNDPQKALKLRSYQKEYLSATKTNKKMVLRQGRRSGKTVGLCADSLWWATAHPIAHRIETGGTKEIPFSILVLTPMDAQIKMIFDTFMDLIADSEWLSRKITKVKRSDVNEIHFDNGSVIKGMTLGISSANKGTSVRGQSCNLLFLDEVDYIPRDIMEEAVLPIAFAAPSPD